MVLQCIYTRNPIKSAGTVIIVVFPSHMLTLKLSLGVQYTGVYIMTVSASSFLNQPLILVYVVTCTSQNHLIFMEEQKIPVKIRAFLSSPLTLAAEGYISQSNWKFCLGNTDTFGTMLWTDWRTESWCHRDSPFAYALCNTSQLAWFTLAQ